MRRVLDCLFAHRLLLAIPMVAAVIGTAAFLVVQPPSYDSSATLWANTGNGAQSAAQTQADVINQYLKQSSFAVAVAQAGPLAAYLDAHPGETQGFSPRSILGGGPRGVPSADAVRAYLGAHVTVSILGPSELTVTAVGPTPEVAHGTADALIAQLAAGELAAKIAQLQTQLKVYQTQLQEQSALVGSDLTAVRTYQAAHPTSSNSSATTTDPQLALLQDRASVDQQTYTQLLAKIEQTESDLALAQQPQLQAFRVVDAPQTPASRSLFGKQQLLALAAGLLGGLLAVVAVAALLVRLDTTVHGASDVESMLGLRAIGSTPLSATG